MTDEKTDRLTRVDASLEMPLERSIAVNERLVKRVAFLRNAVASIKAATAEGRVGDDAGWLHDFCELTLATDDELRSCD
jgi:hypothetical protein